MSVPRYRDGQRTRRSEVWLLNTVCLLAGEQSQMPTGKSPSLKGFDGSSVCFQCHCFVHTDIITELIPPDNITNP